VVGKDGNVLVASIPNLLAFSFQPIFESELIKRAHGPPITNDYSSIAMYLGWAFGGIVDSHDLTIPEFVQTTKGHSGEEPVQFLLDALRPNWKLSIEL